MILLTGGSGLLGKELQKYFRRCIAPTHKEMDITVPINKQYIKNTSLVIHAAGYTDVVQAEKDKVKCFKTNFNGTKNLIHSFHHVPFVHISTEYVNNPVNFYSLTKLEAEKYIKVWHNHWLIIRTLFKPRPFPHKEAFADQWTKGDYVDVIAPLIVSAIELWNMRVPQTIDVGTERKSMYELAQRSNPDVEPISVHDIKAVKLPKDYR